MFIINDEALSDLDEHSTHTEHGRGKYGSWFHFRINGVPLHVQAQSGILQARAQAAQSQVLVQMLRLEAAGQMAAGLSVDAVKDATGEEEKK